MTLLPPGMILVLGGLLLVALPLRLRQVGVVLLPLLSALHMLTLAEGTQVSFDAFGLDLTPVRVDRMALVWGGVFHFAALAAGLFSWGVRRREELSGALVYAGAAIAGVFSGDLVSLFVWWELTAIASVLLVLARGTRASWDAGMRYLVIQVLSGVLLLAGVLFRYNAGGGIDFAHIGWSGSYDSTLILLAFGIKACFPLLHAWLPDAYPEATATGTVWLSAFTTKLAIYALARTFAGTEALVVVGSVMAMAPLVFAVLADDMRRAVSYCLVNQLGFMVIGVGIGSSLAIDGVAAHAVGHVLYKSLLFMALGAVLHRTGSVRASEISGLRHAMPLTAAFYLVGAASIGLPLTAGFVTKSLIISAAGKAGLTLPYLAMLFGAAGAFLVAGVRVPARLFFGTRVGPVGGEAPPHMLAGMGLVAAGCVAVGVAPGLLYARLPNGSLYAPYTVDHVVAQLQLMVGAGVAFGILTSIGAVAPLRRVAIVDVDVVYRRFLPPILRRLGGAYAVSRDAVLGALFAVRDVVVGLAVREAGPGGRLSRVPTTSGAVLSVALLLTLYALLYFQLGDPEMALSEAH